MFNSDFGVNLTDLERNFLNNYCELMKEYGYSSDFPMPDEQKITQYKILSKILDKLTLEEIEAFNKFADTVEMQKFEEQYNSENKSIVR